MALPLNEQYKNLTQVTQSLGKTAYAVGKSLPTPKPAAPKQQPVAPNLYSPKAFDTSQYAPLADKMKGKQLSIGDIGNISTQYGGSTNYEKFHPGIDIANKKGTPLYSTVPGKVVNVVSGKKQGDPGFGNYVEIIDPKGNKHRFSHLSNEFVKVGQVIPQGYMYGTMGDTGSTYSTVPGGDASHLDYRIWDAYNKYVNPMSYFKQ